MIRRTQTGEAAGARAGSGLLLAGLLCQAPALPLPAQQDSGLQVELRNLGWGPFSVERLSRRDLAAGGWRVALSGLSFGEWLSLDITLHCPEPRRAAGDPILQRILGCPSGAIRIRPAGRDTGGDPVVTGTFQSDPAGETLNVALPNARLALGDENRWQLQLDRVPLAGLDEWLPVAKAPPGALPWQVEGALSGSLHGAVQPAAGIQGQFSLENLSFDNAAGNLAGAGVALGGTLAAAADGPGGWRFETDLTWRAGEWLFGAFYLPPPAAPVVFGLAGRRQAGAGDSPGELLLERLDWRHPEVASLRASAAWVSSAPRPAASSAGGSGWLPRRWRVEHFEARLPGLQKAYLNGWLGALGMRDLMTAGTLELQSGGERTATGADQHTTLLVQDLTLGDPGGRFAADALRLQIDWISAAGSQSARPRRSMVSWDRLRLFRLPLEQARIDFMVSGDELRLARPVLVPLLDGGLQFRQLRLARFLRQDTELVLDAELLPVSLDRLGRVLGWPEFGGRLAGTLPGISRNGQRWELDAHIDLDIFGGDVSISNLSLERPFGVLPVLNADVAIRRVQLEPLTSAFDFGRITGPVDGYIRNLRLLDWQPARFDALIRSADNPQVPLRISQRAVDTLSSIGGGIGGGMQAGLLRLFESFRYRQLGLACRLRNGICRMSGIRDHEDGRGYYIIEGSGLPRLDVVAYNRQVDWQRLVAQLQASIRAPRAQVK